jgi:D-xylose 1-dehydrogenase (NADP+, D-xylono-1,5-lactone-forming)
MTRNPVKWGFVGAGGVARLALAPAVNAAEGAVLQAVAARDATRAGALSPLGRVHSDYGDLIDDDDVEAVYISLHNSAHLEWTLRALAAGKHVLCEKPLGCAVAEVDAMIAAAEVADRLLVEATWYRWHPRTQRALALLDTLGPARVVTADFCFGNVPAGDFRLDPAMGGGALADVGCYAVSAAAAFLGATELAVDSANVMMGPSGVDLAATAEVVGGSGRARVRCGIDEMEHQGITVECQGGAMELISTPFTSWHDPADLRVEYRDQHRAGAAGRIEIEQFPEVDAYQVMVEAVSSRIRGGDNWVLPLRESRVVAATLDSIRSAGIARS